MWCRCSHVLKRCSFSHRKDLPINSFLNICLRCLFYQRQAQRAGCCSSAHVPGVEIRRIPVFVFSSRHALFFIASSYGSENILGWCYTKTFHTCTAAANNVLKWNCETVSKTVILSWTVIILWICHTLLALLMVKSKGHRF